MSAHTHRYIVCRYNITSIDCLLGKYICICESIILIYFITSWLSTGCLMMLGASGQQTSMHAWPILKDRERGGTRDKKGGREQRTLSSLTLDLPVQVQASTLHYS